MVEIIGMPYLVSENLSSLYEGNYLTSQLHSVATWAFLGNIFVVYEKRVPFFCRRGVHKGKNYE